VQLIMHLAFSFIALAAIAPMLFVTAAPVDTMALAARDPDPINVSNTFQAYAGVPIPAILHETLTLSCRCYTAYDSFTPKADIEKRCGKIRREAKADPNFLMYADTHSCYAIRDTDHKLAGATSAMRVTSLTTRL
jgi:hypothetical protein